MTMLKKTSLFAIASTLLLLFMPFSLSPEISVDASSPTTQPAPLIQSLTTPDSPLSFSPLLIWDKNPEAVTYEIEFFASQPLILSDMEVSDDAIFRTAHVYSNLYNPPLAEFAADLLGKEPLYWRVRARDFDGNPLTPFSPLAALYTSASLPPMNAPVPLAQYDTERGSTLLYPVYNWIGQYNAASYELQLFDENPEEDIEAAPIDTMKTETAEIYDSTPRYGTQPFYWRVQALDSEGQPIGDWSRANSFRTSPSDNWEIAVLGDSISHGGGHYSYGPADLEFSWLAYLDFSALNLSQSGDLSETTLERFDRDVLPFHPHYLLVLTGTNSLRGGVDPDSVIHDLQTIKEKCLQNNIKPIFLTLPPINPENIEHVFDEPTVADWQERFDKVNDYIRTQVYIDTAAAFNCPNDVLPTEAALDGLHPDVSGKRIMAEAVNEAWEEAKIAANAQE